MAAGQVPPASGCGAFPAGPARRSRRRKGRRGAAEAPRPSWLRAGERGAMGRIEWAMWANEQALAAGLSESPRGAGGACARRGGGAPSPPRASLASPPHPPNDGKTPRVGLRRCAQLASGA